MDITRIRWKYGVSGVRWIEPRAKSASKEQKPHCVTCAGGPNATTLTEDRRFRDFARPDEVCVNVCCTHELALVGAGLWTAYFARTLYVVGKESRRRIERSKGGR
jgi:hypothetical protein